jgi:hypothetical protein
MIKDCQDAAEYLQLPNDFSVEHLQMLENILKHKENLVKNNPTNDAELRENITMELIFLGIYFGEIFRKEIGGDWFFDPQIAKEQGATNDTFLLLNKMLFDPFEPFFGRVFFGKKYGVVEYFQNMAEQIEPGYSVIRKLSVNRSWICPVCREENITLTKVVLRANVTCKKCNRLFLYVSGEVILARCVITKYPLGEYCDWSLRLKLFDDDMTEINFTLRSHEFTIAQGDYVVAFINQKNKVVYLENKTTNTGAIPN